MLELSRAILIVLLLTTELISDYIDVMGAKFEMLQKDKNLRSTSKNKFCGLFRSMKDKGRCNIISYLSQDKHLEHGFIAIIEARRSVNI